LWWNWEPWYCERVLHHRASVYSVGFLRESGHLVTFNVGVGEASVIQSWEIHSGRKIAQLDSDDLTVKVLLPNYSTDGIRYVAGLMNSPGSGIFARVSGKLARELEGSHGWVQSAVFSRDSSRVVALMEANLIGDGRAFVWDMRNGRILATLEGHEGRISSVAFSPDGKRVVSAGIDRTVRVWDVDGGSCACVLRGHEDFVSGAEFSPEGALIVSASRDKTARLWAVGEDHPVSILRGHSASVEKAVFSPDGNRIVTASSDRTARIWKRRRPEWWWGVFWLKEFWFTVAFAGLFVWSILRDRKTFRRQEATNGAHC
jgi:WD40 repeat protein